MKEKEFTLTPEQSKALAKQHDENESFSGKLANMNKLQRYKTLLQLGRDAFDSCDDIIRVSEITPEPSIRNGTVILETGAVASMWEKTVDILKKMMELSDHLGMVIVDTRPDQTGMRMLFMVKDIWE